MSVRRLSLEDKAVAESTDAPALGQVDVEMAPAGHSAANDSGTTNTESTAVIRKTGTPGPAQAAVGVESSERRNKASAPAVDTASGTGPMTTTTNTLKADMVSTSSPSAADANEMTLKEARKTLQSDSGSSC